MQLSPSMLARLESLDDRFEEVAVLLADPETNGNRDRFTALSREFAELEPVIACFRAAERLERELDETRELARDPDPELRALAQDDLPNLEAVLGRERQHLLTLLLPRDPNDAANIFLEIRAGTGGDEAAIFVGDLFRMYGRYAETKGWRLEVLSERPGEHGGYKEIISRI